MTQNQYINKNAFHLGNADFVPPSTIWRLKIACDEKNWKYHVNQLVEKHSEQFKPFQTLEVPLENVLVFARTSECQSSLIKYYIELGTPDLKKYSTSTIHVAEFRFCKNTVYAITWGNAWTLVRTYRDSEFPPIVAARLLNEEGMDRRISKLLFGNNAEEYALHRKPQATSPLEGAIMVTSFTAKLRSKSSIRHAAKHTFSHKQNDKDTSKEKTVYVEIKYGSVRFKTNICYEEYDGIIQHLDKIYRGESTTTTDGREETKTNAYRNHILKCDSLMQEELNTELLKKIELYLYDRSHHNQKDSLDEFELMHKQADSFLLGNDYRILMGRKWYQFLKRPSLTEVLDQLSAKVFNGEPTPDFVGKFKQINFSFKSSDSELMKSKLFSLIEGNVVHEDHAYFRFLGTWFFINKDFNRQVQVEFLDVLKNCLLPSNDVATLKRCWYSNYDELKYNMLCSKDDGFLFGDRLVVNSIELFDLLQKIGSHTYLYQVKKNFDQNMRVACAQIEDAARMLNNYFNDRNKQFLEELFKKISTKYDKLEHNMPSYIDELEKFKNTLDKPKKVRFVLAVGLNDARSRSLHEEKKLKRNIKISDISSMLKINPNILKTSKQDPRKSLKSLAAHIFNLLIHKNYVVKESEKQGYTTSKLFWTTENNFDIGESYNTKLYNSLRNNNYISKFPSLVARLRINKAKKVVEDLGYSFKICEINCSKEIDSDIPTKEKIKDEEKSVPPRNGVRSKIGTDESTPSYEMSPSGNGDGKTKKPTKKTKLGKRKQEPTEIKDNKKQIFEQ